MFSVTKLHNDENFAKHLFSKFCLDSRNYFPKQSFSHFLLKNASFTLGHIKGVCVCLNTAKQAFLIIKFRNLKQLCVCGFLFVFFVREKHVTHLQILQLFSRLYPETSSLFMVLRIFMSTPHFSTNYCKYFSTPCNVILKFTII